MADVTIASNKTSFVSLLISCNTSRLAPVALHRIDKIAGTGCADNGMFKLINRRRAEVNNRVTIGQ